MTDAVAISGIVTIGGIVTIVVRSWMNRLDKKVSAVSVKIDGRMDELLALTKDSSQKAGHKEGMKDGKIEERAEVKERKDIKDQEDKNK